MPGQHVDRTTLPADLERCFDRALPAETGEQPDNGLTDGGVRGVEQPIQLLSAPTNTDVELAPKRDHQTLHTVDGDAANDAAFDARY